MADPTLYGRLFPNETSGDRAGFYERFRSLMLNVNTAIPVQVITVASGGVNPVGLLDCKILASQLTGNNQTVENAILSNLPYMRYQGGSNAVIIDPQPGDIGIAIFAQRDISAIKNVRRESVPPSKRIHDISDGMYVGGILNGTPSQYILFDGAGITILSPSVVTINAPSATVNAPSISLNGDVTISGNTTMQQNFTVLGQTNMANVTFNNHVHNETGTVTTGPRNP